MATITITDLLPEQVPFLNNQGQGQNSSNVQTMRWMTPDGYKNVPREIVNDPILQRAVNDLKWDVFPEEPDWDGTERRGMNDLISMGKLRFIHVQNTAPYPAQSNAVDSNIQPHSTSSLRWKPIVVHHPDPSDNPTTSLPWHVEWMDWDKMWEVPEPQAPAVPQPTAYIYGLKGDGVEDYTSFVRHWAYIAPDNLPPGLLCISPPTSDEPMIWAGFGLKGLEAYEHNSFLDEYETLEYPDGGDVLGIDGKPMRNLKNWPHRIASNVEPWFVEALLLSVPESKVDDIIQRQHGRRSRNGVWTPGYASKADFRKWSHNLTKRRGDWRKRAKMLSRGNGMDASKTDLEALTDHSDLQLRRNCRIPIDPSTGLAGPQLTNGNPTAAYQAGWRFQPYNGTPYPARLSAIVPTLQTYNSLPQAQRTPWLKQNKLWRDTTKKTDAATTARRAAPATTTASTSTSTSTRQPRASGRMRAVQATNLAPQPIVTATASSLAPFTAQIPASAPFAAPALGPVVPGFHALAPAFAPFSAAGLIPVIGQHDGTAANLPALATGFDINAAQSAIPSLSQQTGSAPLFAPLPAGAGHATEQPWEDFIAEFSAKYGGDAANDSGIAFGNEEWTTFGAEEDQEGQPVVGGDVGGGSVVVDSGNPNNTYHWALPAEQDAFISSPIFDENTADLLSQGVADSTPNLVPPDVNNGINTPAGGVFARPPVAPAAIPGNGNNTSASVRSSIPGAAQSQPNNGATPSNQTSRAQGNKRSRDDDDGTAAPSAELSPKRQRVVSQQASHHQVAYDGLPPIQFQGPSRKRARGVEDEIATTAAAAHSPKRQRRTPEPASQAEHAAPLQPGRATFHPATDFNEQAQAHAPVLSLTIDNPFDAQFLEDNPSFASDLLQELGADDTSFFGPPVQQGNSPPVLDAFNTGFNETNDFTVENATATGDVAPSGTAASDIAPNGVANNDFAPADVANAFAARNPAADAYYTPSPQNGFDGETSAQPQGIAAWTLDPNEPLFDVNQYFAMGPSTARDDVASAPHNEPASAATVTADAPPASHDDFGMPFAFGANDFFPADGQAFHDQALLGNGDGRLDWAEFGLSDGTLPGGDGGD